MENKENNFETNIAKLQSIVDKLESDVSLDESMALFESGLKLTKDCIEELNKTQQTIAELKKQLEGILVSVPEGSDER